MPEPEQKSTMLDAEADSPGDALRLAGERFINWQRNFPSCDPHHAAPAVYPLANGRYGAAIWVVYVDRNEPLVAP